MHDETPFLVESAPLVPKTLKGFVNRTLREALRSWRRWRVTTFSPFGIAKMEPRGVWRSEKNANRGSRGAS